VLVVQAPESIDKELVVREDHKVLEVLRIDAGVGAVGELERWRAIRFIVRTITSRRLGVRITQSFVSEGMLLARQ
jgi:hypothetical protein